MLFPSRRLFFDLTMDGYVPFGLIGFPTVCGCVLRVSEPWVLILFRGTICWSWIFVFGGSGFPWTCIFTIDCGDSLEFFFSWLIWNGYYVPWRFLLAFGAGFTPQHNLGWVSVSFVIYVVILHLFGFGASCMHFAEDEPFLLFPNTTWVSFFFFLWCRMWILTLFFFLPNTTWWFFAGIGSIPGSFFFFFVFALGGSAQTISSRGW